MPFDFDADPVTLSGLFPTTAAPVQVDVYGFCTLNCFYCFANLNKKAASRELNLQNSTAKALRYLERSLHDDADPIGFFLRQKYFTGFSNTTDPFQRDEKTYRASEAVLGWAQANDQPLFIETKGNVLLEEWDHYRPLLDPERVAVYLTLSMLDDRLRRKYEPGALSVEGRLELLRLLAAAGFDVVAACNPYVPDWVPDLDAYCATVKEAGAASIFPFYLHFSPEQVDQVPDFYRDDVRKANIVPAYQLQGFRRWQESSQRTELGLYLAPQWDAILGYPGDAGSYQAALAQHRRFYPFHHFMTEAARQSHTAGDVPVEFTWWHLEDFLRREGVPDVMLSMDAFNTVFCHCSEDHKLFRTMLGKRNSFFTMLGWLFNHPWVSGSVAWSDPHVRAVLNPENGDYERTGDGDLIAVWLPRVSLGDGELLIHPDDFDLEHSVVFTPLEVPHERDSTAASTGDGG